MDLIKNLNHYGIRTTITKWFPIPILSFLLVQLSLSDLAVIGGRGGIALCLPPVPHKSCSRPPGFLNHRLYLSPLSTPRLQSRDSSDGLSDRVTLIPSSPPPILQEHSSIKQVSADNLSLAWTAALSDEQSVRLWRFHSLMTGDSETAIEELVDILSRSSKLMGILCISYAWRFRKWNLSGLILSKCGSKWSEKQHWSIKKGVILWKDFCGCSLKILMSWAERIIILFLGNTLQYGCTNMHVYN